jgi:hypothetical protein
LVNAAQSILFVARQYLESNISTDERERRAIALGVDELQGYIARGEEDPMARATRRLRMLLPHDFDPTTTDRSLAAPSQ